MINKQDKILIYDKIKDYFENNEVIKEIGQTIEVEIVQILIVSCVVGTVASI